MVKMVETSLIIIINRKHIFLNCGYNMKYNDYKMKFVMLQNAYYGCGKN